MGHEIDAAYKNWIKEPQKLFRPKITDKIIVTIDDATEYYEIFSDCGNESYINKFIYPNFDKEYFNLYKECTNNFIKEIKQFKSIKNKKLHQWLLQQENKMLLYDYKCFYVSSDIEEFIANRWIGYDEIKFNEDGKLLYSAIHNLDSLYGLNLYDSIISAEDLFYYDEEDEYSKELDERIQKDISYLIENINNYFSGVIKKPDDKFFEDRNKRLEIIRSIIEQGGKMVYSF